ncbi:hypothetical protein [Embleya sp. NPDC001921]
MEGRRADTGPLSHLLDAHHDSPDADDARDLAALLDHAVHGKLRADVGYRADWKHTATALEDLGHGRVRGKAVLGVS